MAGWIENADPLQPLVVKTAILESGSQVADVLGSVKE